MTRKNFPVTDRIEQIAALITADGIDTHAITEAMGFKTRSRTAVLMRQMVADGLAFAFGSGNASLRYFADAASRDAYAVAYREEMAARRRQACCAASRRYRGPSMLPTPREREADVKEARQRREKAAKKSTTARLKKETKEAGALIFKTGTSTPAPKKSAWADIPAFIPDGVEPVELPNTLRDRFAVDEAPPCFSSLRPGQYIAPAPAWLQGVDR